MRWHPHEYTVREWHQDAGTEPEFEAMVQRIREHGYEDTFGKRTFTYLEVDGWRYWTMGNSHRGDNDHQPRGRGAEGGTRRAQGRQA